MSKALDQLGGLPMFESFGGEEGLVRRSDGEFSHDAADVIKPKLGKIQWAVIEAFRRYGPMSARTVETLPELDNRKGGSYGYSTVRKRVSELFRIGVLEYVPGGDGPVYRLNESRVKDPLVDEAPRCPHCGQIWRGGR
jgi:hypothetical protein